MNIRHELKAWPAVYQQVVEGVKTHEFRKNDRGFNTGDILILKEWDDSDKAYTGRSVLVTVTCITYGPVFGIPEGYCVMSVRLPGHGGQLGDLIP